MDETQEKNQEIDNDVNDADDPQEIEEERLFEKNMDALKRCVPGLHKSLAEHKPVSKLIYLEDGEPDVEFQGFTMYPDGAVTHAKRQTDQLEGHSFRFRMEMPDTTGLDLHSRQAVNTLTRRFDESGFRFAPHPVRDSAYFLVVFGIGLGQHLMELVERTQCRVLILAEPNIDLIYHSMKVFDWDALFERFGDAGTIELFVSTNPKELTQSIQTVFRRHNPVSMDGTIAFRHYGSAIFQEAERALPDLLRTAIMGLGFYQDEINMIGQSYKNLEKGDSRVIQKLEENPNIPAFIIGSGPSLENLLPFVEKNQDKALVISCGTSVDVLLEHGITPDIWAIAERDYDILSQARETNELYGTKDIHFIGSTTIFPGVYELFKDAIFFFRPGLSCSPLFAQSEDQIALIPDPLAVNAGLSAAIHLGFREFYFIGVDTGSKYQSHGHAKNSWYTRHDAENIKDLSIPLPGNFGGTVWTTAELQWSKENIEKLIILSQGRVYYNLGDGALIKGATPKHPKAVKLKDPSVSKTKVIETLIEQCPRFEVSDFEDRWERGAVIDRLFEFCEGLKRAAQTENDPNGFEFIHKTVKILKPHEVGEALYMLLRGTLFTMMICNEYYANRLIDPLEREAQSKIFRDEYCSLIDRLRDRAVEIFKELEIGMTWEQFHE